VDLQWSGRKLMKLAWNQNICFSQNPCSHSFPGWSFEELTGGIQHHAAVWRKCSYGLAGFCFPRLSILYHYALQGWTYLVYYAASVERAGTSTWQRASRCLFGGLFRLVFHRLSWTMTISVDVPLTVLVISHCLLGASPFLAICSTASSRFWIRVCIGVPLIKRCPAHCIGEVCQALISFISRTLMWLSSMA